MLRGAHLASKPAMSAPVKPATRCSNQRKLGRMSVAPNNPGRAEWLDRCDLWRLEPTVRLRQSPWEGGRGECRGSWRSDQAWGCPYSTSPLALCHQRTKTALSFSSQRALSSHSSSHLSHCHFVPRGNGKLTRGPVHPPLLISATSPSCAAKQIVP